jgi:hypothetical protein
MTEAASVASQPYFAAICGAGACAARHPLAATQYQNPQGHKATAKGEQGALDFGAKDTATKAPRPESLSEQIVTVQAALPKWTKAPPNISRANSNADGRVRSSRSWKA